MTDLSTLLACPRCDKSPLEQVDDKRHCNACKIDFPSVDDIPWMFAEPEAALGEWRGRLQLALQKLSHEIAGLDQELKNKDLTALAKRRVDRYRKCVDSHRRKLQTELYGYNNFRVLFVVSGGQDHIAKMQHVFARVIDNGRIAGLFLYTTTAALEAKGPLGTIWENGAGEAARLV